MFKGHLFQVWHRCGRLIWIQYMVDTLNICVIINIYIYTKKRRQMFVSRIDISWKRSYVKAMNKRYKQNTFVKNCTVIRRTVKFTTSWFSYYRFDIVKSNLQCETQRWSSLKYFPANNSVNWISLNGKAKEIRDIQTTNCIKPLRSPMYRKVICRYPFLAFTNSLFTIHPH